ncbi:nucleoid-associated protein [Algibacillus agarilyticus]|uniref:nucleoid-associated protein n=1 Tax=Algibacillus agarilyticus TaxID=2234133 RepID=UPI000DCF8C59|nr:nucleoid-associated protein [Algibacillus agarilyticus]
MSISSAQIYFNRLIHGDNRINLQLSAATCVDGQTAEYLAEGIHTSFIKKGQKEYCQFKDDSEVAEQLKSGVSGQALADHIFNALQQSIDVEAPPAESILVVACYQHLASEYVLAAVLGVKDSVLLNDAISAERSQYLDIANIQLAVQLDMSEFGVNPDSERAIAYIKGRVGRTVNDFMADALGIEPKLNAKDATQKLIETVETFISDNSDDEKASSVREVTLDVMKNASEVGDFLDVQHLSEEIEEKTGLAGFYDKAAEDEEFNDSCPVYLSASKSLKKFFGQGGGMSLSFNRELLGEHIHYDPIAKTLKFTKLPPNLLDALEKNG